MWPQAISRRSARPATTRGPRRGLRVRRPTWNQVSKSGGALGGDAARGRPHLRPRAARDQPRALRRREVVPHRLRLRRQELADHQLPAVAPSALGVQVRPLVRGQLGRASRARGRTATSVRRAQSTRRPSDPRPAPVEIECKVLILAAGRDGRRRRSCMRSQQRTLPVALAPASASTSASTATTSPRSSTTRSKVRERARPARLRRLPQGQADHDDELRLLGRARAATRYDGTRFTSRRSSSRRSPTSSTTTAAAPAGEPVLVGPARRSGRSRLGQPHRAPGDGRGHPRRRRSSLPPPERRRACSRTPGRSASGSSTTRSPSSRSACARRPTRR